MGKCLIDISGFEVFYGTSVACDLAFVFVCGNKKIYEISNVRKTIANKNGNISS